MAVSLVFSVKSLWDPYCDIHPNRNIAMLTVYPILLSLYQRCLDQWCQNGYLAQLVSILALRWYVHRILLSLIKPKNHCCHHLMTTMTVVVLIGNKDTTVAENVIQFLLMVFQKRFQCLPCSLTILFWGNYKIHSTQGTLYHMLCCDGMEKNLCYITTQIDKSTHTLS